MKDKKVVVFGIQNLSSLACFCLEHDSSYSVSAFCLDGDYITSDTHQGLPVVAFEDLEYRYPPGSVEVLIPLGFKWMNGLRKDVFSRVKSKGYALASYVSSKAGTWPDLEIPENVLIYENTVVQPFSAIGKNTVIRSSVHISHHNWIGDHVFIAAGAVFGGNVTVGEQSVIGLGAVLRSSINIAPKTFIGAGAVVVKDTEPDCVYVGNPAKKFHKNAIEVSG